MKHCLNCDINFNTYENFCPLCQNKLKGSCTDYLFPHNIIYKNKQRILQKLLLFITLIALLIVLSADISVNKKVGFSGYSTLGIISGYIVLNCIILNYNNLIKLFMKLGALINVLIIIWFIYVRVLVLTNYIIPSICLLEIMYCFIISLILKERFFLEYSRLLFINLFFLLIPIIIFLTGNTSNNIMIYICFVTFVSSALALLTFAKDSIKDEIKKMTNIKLDI